MERLTSPTAEEPRETAWALTEEMEQANDPDLGRFDEEGMILNVETQNTAQVWKFKPASMAEDHRLSQQEVGPLTIRHDRCVFEEPSDALNTLPGGLPDEFTTADPAEAIDGPRWLARKVDYCLRKMESLLRSTSGEGQSYTSSPTREAATRPLRPRRRQGREQWSEIGGATMVQGQVLVLNANGAPLDIVGIEKAVGMMMRGVVMAVEGTAARLRTAGGEIFHVPSVLAVKRFVNAPRNVGWSRYGVLKRDAYTCIYCGQRLHRSACTIDHLRPRSQGGESTWSNTACACRDCNGRKADRWPHEAGMQLLWEPKRPRWDCIRISGEVPVEWKAYLPG